MIFLVIFLVSCTKIHEQSFDEVAIDSGKKITKVKVEIADDNEEREKGLMFREKLNENEGMLFVFEDESYRAFWMKNTLIPLDMIFINGNFEIVDIKNANPCREGQCVLYKPSKPAKYVLEAGAGFAGKNSISIGDKVAWNKKD